MRRADRSGQVEPTPWPALREQGVPFVHRGRPGTARKRAIHHASGVRSVIGHGQLQLRAIGHVPMCRMRIALATRSNNSVSHNHSTGIVRNPTQSIQDASSTGSVASNRAFRGAVSSP